MGTVLRWLEARSLGFVLAASFAVIVLFALLDFLLGAQVRFFIFYWPPIAAVAWRAGRRWGLLFVALGGLAWAAANVTDYMAQAQFQLALWNTAVNVVSFALLSLLISALRRVVDRERDLARTDFMTGAANARAFLPILQQEIARSQRQGHPLTLAYLDLDDFKQVNDRWGHSAGDALLQTLSEALLHGLRGSDVLARLGGDEFAILLPETDERQAEAALSRLRERARSALSEKGWEVGLSIGMITCSGPPCTAEDLVGKADALMYEVKVGRKDGVLHRVCEPGGTPGGG